MQDYIVTWTQGLWDHINKFDAATDRQRAGRARAKHLPLAISPTGSGKVISEVAVMASMLP
jgi:hypothetical protein